MKIKDALLLFLFFGLSLTAAAQKIFKDEKYGFSMLEAHDWVKVLNRDPYFNLDKNNGKNIVTFNKYEKGSYLKGNSTINVSVESAPGNIENFIKKMLNPVKWNEHYYLDYSVVKAPELVQLDGKTAITGTVNFKYNSHSGEGAFKKKIYYIISDKNLFKVVFIASLADDNDLKLFDELVPTIKISK